MKIPLLALSAVLLLMRADAQPVRVALLEFEDASGQSADPLLGGTIRTEALAAKGTFPLGKAMVDNPGIVLLDRREFIAQVENTRRGDDGKPADATPSFLHAAQAMRADTVLRGKLLGFSTGKRVIDQGGFKADFSRVSLRVGLEALDAVDGTVIGVSQASVNRDIRQTGADQTVLSEEDALSMLGEAVGTAASELTDSILARVGRNQDRPRVKLSVLSTVDPALVEIDGILVGTTPLENFGIYKGDHVLTVGKPGHRDVTKRILIEKDSRITVPLMRVELTADEIKGILDKARLSAYIGIEPALVIETIETTNP